jgi:hypothetical protein
MNIKDIKGKSRCDSGHEFENRAVELVKFGTGFHAPLAQLKFVAKDGTLCAGTPKATDSVLACPTCHQVHLFGFNPA